MFFLICFGSFEKIVKKTCWNTLGVFDICLLRVLLVLYFFGLGFCVIFECFGFLLLLRGLAPHLHPLRASARAGRSQQTARAPARALGERPGEAVER